jgi:predicted nucleic acid-binding protein
MRVPCFLDTNILLYAAGGRRSEPAKHKIALEILDAVQPVISTQVIGEFCHVSRRKFAKEISVSSLDTWLETLMNLKCVDVDQTLLRSALYIAERYKISFWDAALVAASEMLGATVLYSEDLSHQQKYRTVTVINPFKAN